ncbi:hypothetical protein ABIC84_004227 [Mucilaginibacter sp. 3215]
MDQIINAVNNAQATARFIAENPASYVAVQGTMEGVKRIDQ